MRLVEQLDSISGGHDYQCILQPLQQAIGSGCHIEEEWGTEPNVLSSLDASQIFVITLYPSPGSSNFSVSMSHYDCNQNTMLFQSTIVQPNEFLQRSSDNNTATFSKSVG